MENNNTTFTVCYETDEAIFHGQFESRRMETLPTTYATIREAIDAAKPFAMADRRTQIRFPRFTQTAKFRKGDVAFWVRGHAVEQLAIQSWGKEQGTATTTKNGEFTRHRFYANTTPVFATREEAEAYAAAIEPANEFTGLSGSLACELSVADCIKPQYRASHAERIRVLRERIANF